MVKRNIIWGLLVFALLSLTIITTWFREGLIYGGGDAGLPTYNPTRIFEISKFIWWEAAAPGALMPNSTVSAPLAFALSILQKVGFSPLLLQALTFFILLFLMGFGMYVFCLYLFEFKKPHYAFLAGIFYMFNPFMMIQVWHRFIHTTFFLAAFLPFLILFWTFWIKQGKLKYLLLFLLTSFLAVYSFGTLAYIVSFWLIIFLISISSALFPFKAKSFIRTMILLFIGLLCWFLTNIWWFIPTFSVGPALLSEQHNNEESVVTLVNMSRQAVLPYTLQMVNPFYLFAQQDFGSFYMNSMVRLLPWLFVGTMWIGLVVGLKQREIIKWSFIFMIVLFLAKGASPPLGDLFIWGFKNFFPLGVLRNPFEKIGILLPFLNSVLFIVGTKATVNYLNKKGGKSGYIFISIIIAAIVLFHWPVWTGQLFGKVGKPAAVQVPESYKKTDDWIKSDDVASANRPGKILHLPLSVSEAISYNWDFAYSGVEPSALFFTASPSISHSFYLKYVDDSLKAIPDSLADQNIDTKALLNIIRSFNIKYIVLHKDILWKENNVDDPKKVEDKLAGLDFLGKSYQESDLIVYKINDESFKDRLFIANSVDLILGNNFNNPLTPFLFRQNDDSVSILNNNFDNSFNNYSLILVTPQENYVYKTVPPLQADNLIGQILANESLLQRWLEPLDQAQISLRQNGEYPAAELNDLIIKSTKDAFKLVKNYSTDEYMKDLQKIFATFSGSRLFNYIKKEDLSTIFQIQLRILKSISDQTKNSAVTDIYKVLNEKMIKNNLLPQYQEAASSSAEDKRVFVFNIPMDGEYDIVLHTFEPAEKIDGQEFYINGVKEKIKVESFKQGISIYRKSFKQGHYEIQLPVSLSKNFFQADDVVMVKQELGFAADADIHVEFIRKSPVYYQGRFSIDKPSMLVFSETYHPGWNLTLASGTDKTEQKHYLANLYGNGWFIGKPGSYEFILEFIPQKWVNRGIVIAVATYLGLFCATLWQRKRC